MVKMMLNYKKHTLVIVLFVVILIAIFFNPNRRERIFYWGFGYLSMEKLVFGAADSMCNIAAQKYIKAYAADENQSSWLYGAMTISEDAFEKRVDQQQFWAGIFEAFFKSKSQTNVNRYKQAYNCIFQIAEAQAVFKNEDTIMLDHTVKYGWMVWSAQSRQSQEFGRGGFTSAWNFIRARCSKNLACLEVAWKVLDKEKDAERIDTLVHVLREGGEAGFNYALKILNGIDDDSIVSNKYLFSLLKWVFITNDLNWPVYQAKTDLTNVMASLSPMQQKFLARTPLYLHAMSSSHSTPLGIGVDNKQDPAIVADLEPCFSYWAEHKAKFFDAAEYPVRRYSENANGKIAAYKEEFEILKLQDPQSSNFLCNLKIKKTNEAQEEAPTLNFFSAMLGAEKKEPLLHFKNAFIAPLAKGLRVYRPDGRKFKRKDLGGFQGSHAVSGVSAVIIQKCKNSGGWGTTCPEKKRVVQLKDLKPFSKKECTDYVNAVRPMLTSENNYSSTWGDISKRGAIIDSKFKCLNSKTIKEVYSLTEGGTYIAKVDCENSLLQMARIEKMADIPTVYHVDLTSCKSAR